MNRSYCGEHIDYQFGRSRTCIAGDDQCTQCKLNDALARIEELESAYEEIGEIDQYKRGYCDWYNTATWNTSMNDWHFWKTDPPETQTVVWAKWYIIDEPVMVKTCKRHCCVSDRFGSMSLPSFWKVATTEETAVFESKSPLNIDMSETPVLARRVEVNESKTCGLVEDQHEELALYRT